MATTLPCEKCGSMKSRVLDSRSWEGGTIRRRRECLDCKHRYNTRESVEGVLAPSQWPIGANVQTKRSVGLKWRGGVVGHWRRRTPAGFYAGCVVENSEGAVMAFADDRLIPWDGMRYHVPIEWTPEMISTLRKMRAKGFDYYLCAERIGVTYLQLATKARELGLNGRMNSGPRSGRKDKEERDADRNND